MIKRLKYKIKNSSLMRRIMILTMVTVMVAAIGIIALRLAVMDTDAYFRFRSGDDHEVVLTVTDKVYESIIEQIKLMEKSRLKLTVTDEAYSSKTEQIEID